MRETAIVCPEMIKKRNGIPVPFDVKKIRDAIRKANDAARVEAIAPYQFEKLVDEVVEAIPEGETPNVEQVQDLVEEKLGSRHRLRIARKEQTEAFAAASALDDILQKATAQEVEIQLKD